MEDEKMLPGMRETSSIQGRVEEYALQKSSISRRERAKGPRVPAMESWPGVGTVTPMPLKRPGVGLKP
jgi:hypothetical protein